MKANDADHDVEYVITEIKIKCGQEMNVDVAVICGNLISPDGEIIPFDAFACPGCYDDSQPEIPVDKTFTLKATPGAVTPQNNNTIFSGGYRVLFMYN